LVNKIKIWILVEYNFDLVQIWLHKSSMGGCLGTAMLLWKKWTQFANVTNICLHVFLVITVLSLAQANTHMGEVCQNGFNSNVSQIKHLRLLPSFVQNLHIHSDLCSQTIFAASLGIVKW